MTAEFKKACQQAASEAGLQNPTQGAIAYAHLLRAIKAGNPDLVVSDYNRKTGQHFIRRKFLEPLANGDENEIRQKLEGLAQAHHLAQPRKESERDPRIDPGPVMNDSTISTLTRGFVIWNDKGRG